MTQLATLSQIEEAQRALKDIIVRTPLVPLRNKDSDSSDIYLKPEIHQAVTSFKLRGVFYAVQCLTDSARNKGLSTVSAGNTAQALAWAGRHFGVAARSIMPETAPRTKIEAVEALGGIPVLVPIAEVFRFMQEKLWENEPYAYIDPWINPQVHAGHGSLGLEILADMPDVKTVFVPVGGGGLLAGVGAAIKATHPDVRLVAVEPEGCPSFHRSRQAGSPQKVECKTLCDGVAVPYMTDEMFPLLNQLADDAVLVSETRVREMIRLLALENKMVVEGSGALPLAAALDMHREERGKSVCILTGGSLDSRVLIEILGERT